MKKLSFSLLLSILLTLIAVGATACWDRVATPSSSESTDAIAFLRSEATASGSATFTTAQELQASRRAAKIAEAYNREAITSDSAPVNIYVLPLSLDDQGTWSPGSENKITDKAAAYTSVHLSLNRTSIVFTEIVKGYNQVFTSIPSSSATMGQPLQLTTDAEQHWTPHMSPDGSKVAFTKPDPKSSGGLVCVINNAPNATEDCLDFSDTTPVLKGAYMRHASWTPDGKIVFEGWGGSFNSDEIFLVNADGSGFTQITNNAGSNNYDECPSVSVDGTKMVVDTWNDAAQEFEITGIDLRTKQRSKISTTLSDTKADAWDPLYTRYTFFWVSQQADDSSVELYMNGYSLGPTRFTNNTYADYFDSNARQ